MSGQRYTPEFKEEAIKQVLERGYSPGDVASQKISKSNSMTLIYGIISAGSPYG